jgi:ribose transport system permease protein
VKRLLLKQPWMGPFAALVALWVFFAVRAPGFASAANAATMARQTTVVAICSVGMTLVIVSGGIDLSVGSAVAFTTVVVAATLKAGLSPVVAVLAGVAVAAFSGALSGALVAYVRMAPFIVTLGAMSILRGGAKGLAGEQKIDCDPRGIDSLLAPSSGVLLPAGVWIAVLLGVAGALALRYTRFGRHVYAVGSNEATALVCGVDVPRVKLLVYALAGALTGIAGIMEFSRLTVGDPTDSIGLELEVIAAVVVGGASLSGGEGTVVGSLVGAVLIAVIRTGCTFLGVHNWVQEIVTGGIIVMAVALDRFRHRAT